MSITEYLLQFDPIIKKFPIEDHILLNHHKTISKEQLSLIKNQTEQSSLKSQLENEYSKIKERNVSLYQSVLQEYLMNNFISIDENVRNGKYKEISEYKTVIDTFIQNTNAKAPNGPDREILIYQFVLNQLMMHSEILVSGTMEEYETLLTTNKEELDHMTKNILSTKDEFSQIRNQIEEKASQIKKYENEKTEMLKKCSKESESFSKMIKSKSAEIAKLNEQIERIEQKNNHSLNEMKSKVDSAEAISQEKKKKANEIQSEASKQKMVLVNKVQLLDKNIKDLNEQRNAEMKILKKEAFYSSSSSSSTILAIEKYETQIKTLNAKIFSMQEKNIDLESLLIDKDKRLENEKAKSEEMIIDYEKQLAELKLRRENTEEEIKSIEEEENENEQKIKMDFEQRLSELKSTKSKNAIIFKESEQNLTMMISKANSDLEKLKNEGISAKSRLEEIKLQIGSDKVEYDKYIKILEDNNKRLLCQYEESVKENNQLKTQQEDNLLHLNAENEKQVIALTKQNDSLKLELNFKQSELETNKSSLLEKITETEAKIPLLKEKELELNQMFTQITKERQTIEKEYAELVSQSDFDYKTELEKVRRQYASDIEMNTKVNEKNIIEINDYCETEKKDLLNKEREEEEMNAKRETEVIQTYNEKIKIIEEIKDEKIEELSQNIREAEANHQAYTEEVEEDLREKSEQIEKINEELNETTINLNTIQSTHETVMKTHYENFKLDKMKLEAEVKEYYSTTKESAVKISVLTINNNHIQSQIDILSAKYEKYKLMLEEQKAKYESTMASLNNDIRIVNNELITIKADYEKNIALKHQEIDYINTQVTDYQNQLEEFKATFEEKLAQCQEEIRNEYSQKLTMIQQAKIEVEEALINKRKELKELEIQYHNTTALLIKEKEVLMEKLNNVTIQTKELSENLIKEREENELKIYALSAEYKSKNSQIAKENEVIIQKLKKIQGDYTELSNTYEKDSSLWVSQYNHLEEQKEKANHDLTETKKKNEQNVFDLQQKFIADRESFEQIYRDVLNKKEEEFNKRLNTANKLFGVKIEEVNSQNQTLTLENMELIDKLEKYEHESSLKEKEKKLTLTRESESRLRIDYENVSIQKEKEIEVLNRDLLKERKEYTAKMIELENKLREYEGKRNSLVVNIVRQKAVNDKDQDGQTTLIERLTEKIATLEKMNMRLATENKEAMRDNEKMKKKVGGSHNSTTGVYLPKYKITSGNKENYRTPSNIPNDHLEMLHLNKKNLLSKFNQKDDENKLITSQNNSFIQNE